MKKLNSWANKMAKKAYKFYLQVMEIKKMEAVKFQSDARKAELLDQETLVGVTTGAITQNILEGVRTGAITRKTIRDAYVKDVLENFDKNRYLSWNFHQFVMKKRQFGSKSLTASGIGDKETN
ncbi:hypothetical protein ABKV19_011847 [Rosa sericea]